MFKRILRDLLLKQPSEVFDYLEVFFRILALIIIIPVLPILVKMSYDTMVICNENPVILDQQVHYEYNPKALIDRSGNVLYAVFNPKANPPIETEFLSPSVKTDSMSFRRDVLISVPGEDGDINMEILPSHNLPLILTEEQFNDLNSMEVR